jgi:ATP-binding cassette, subfamily B, bacterial
VPFALTNAGRRLSRATDSENFMKDSLIKYTMAYTHLWETFGRSWSVRFSFLLQILIRIGRLIILPVALALVITRLSTADYVGAMEAVFLFVVVSLVVGILTPLVKYVGMLGENKIYRELTASYFSKLCMADLEYFNSNLSGYLTTATRQYVDSGVILVRAIRDKYTNTILSIVFPLAVILWIDSKLGLVALVISLLQAIYLIWSSHTIDSYRKTSRELYRINSGRMADRISNIMAVRSASQEEVYVQRVKQGAYDEAEVYTRRQIIQALMIAGREFLTVIFFTLLLWLTVIQTSSSQIDLVNAVIVITYITTILAGIHSLSENLDEHDDLIDRIIPAFEILERKNIINDSESPIILDKISGSIKFDRVSFSYQDQGDTLVLKDFTLEIPNGQKLGVVGLSGAGKSTLTKLLLRLNDVNEGQILLDGIDIRAIKQKDLRRNIAYVPQEPLLFHASIRENLLLSRPNASETELIKALQIAHANNFIAQLPNGIDSIVGERGVKLSGGQKQRIAIARAVLQDSPIMVLDEATSALDSESEQIIKNAFTEILSNKTAIVVAHRLSTLSEMDRIIVIAEGQIVEDGNHATLLARNGLYARLFMRQMHGVDDSTS